MGFIVRPFRRIILSGELGDMVGRKYTFLLTLLIIRRRLYLRHRPYTRFSTIGILAPMLVLMVRLAQGLALGGEYGGAAMYVAGHTPANKEDIHTSFIQTTATLGLFDIAGRDTGYPHFHGHEGVQRLGLAHPVLAERVSWL